VGVIIGAEIDGVNKYSIYKRADTKRPTKRAHKKHMGHENFRQNLQKAFYPALSLIGVHRFNNAHTIFTVFQYEKANNNKSEIFIFLIQLYINIF